MEWNSSFYILKCVCVCVRALFSAISVAALKQVLVTQLMAQNDGERMGRRLLRTTSLRTSCRTQDASSGDTGFYEGTEDYGERVTFNLLIRKTGLNIKPTVFKMHRRQLYAAANKKKRPNNRIYTEIYLSVPGV